MDYLLDGFLRALQLLYSGDAQTWSAVSVSLTSSSLAVFLSLFIGSPLGFLLGYTRFPGQEFIRILVNTLLSFPTVVIGLLVYLMLSRQGPLGNLGLLFSVPGMVLGQTLLGLPVVIALTASAVESMDKRLRLTLLSLGAGRWQMFCTTLWEARYHIILAAVAAYGRIVSEVGISMMVGGNIKWHTRTITTAIALETGKGEFAMGIALGLVLLFMAFGVNATAYSLRRVTAR